MMSYDVIFKILEMGSWIVLFTGEYSIPPRSPVDADPGDWVCTGPPKLTMALHAPVSYRQLTSSLQHGAVVFLSKLFCCKYALRRQCVRLWVWVLSRCVWRVGGYSDGAERGGTIVTVVLRGVKIQNRLNLQAERFSLQCGLST